MLSIDEKIRQMGLVLPEVPIPVAAYIPGILVDGYVYTSGQLPMKDGVLRTGKLGADLSEQSGYEAAEICVLNCLAVVKSLAGSLDRVERIIKVTGYVNSTPESTNQPKVINGASEMLYRIFEGQGVHARSAVGVAALPLGACCEIEMIAKLRMDM